MNERIIRQCVKNRCVKVRKDKTCLAFKSPEFQWRNEQCFGFTDSAQDLRDLFDDIWNYEIKISKLTKYFIGAIAECLDAHDKEEN